MSARSATDSVFATVHSSVADDPEETGMADSDLADSSDSRPRPMTRCATPPAPTSESEMTSQRATIAETAESPTTTVEIEPEPEEDYDAVCSTMTSQIAKSIVEHSTTDSMSVDCIRPSDVTSYGSPVGESVNICTSDAVVEETGDTATNSASDESDDSCTKQKKTNGRKTGSKNRSGSTSGK